MDKTFSHSALAGYIRKIHLIPGDVLVVSNIELLKQLQRMPGIGFYVPVLFAPDGKGIDTATREQLIEAIERIDESVAAAQGIT